MGARTATNPNQAEERLFCVFQLIPFIIFALLVVFPPQSKLKSGVTEQALLTPPHYGVYVPWL